MKHFIAKYTNGLLVAVALTIVTTASVWTMHRPETPQELLRK
jgi:cyclic lactone autoinducer peptide